MTKKPSILIDNLPPTESTPILQKVSQLNAKWREKQALSVLSMAILDEFPGRIVVSSSFGAESAVLLHLVSRVYRAVPVIFLETGMHFSETHEYRDKLIDVFGLREVRIIRPNPQDVLEVDPNETLHQIDTDKCCNLRKVNPLNSALEQFDGWITGRKRYQSAERVDLPIFEEDKTGKVKVNPLANWSMSDVETYADNFRLPKHPLVEKGYASIGCEVCTSPTSNGEDPRSGRWRGSEKTECGIHITKDGKIERLTKDKV